MIVNVVVIVCGMEKKLACITVYRSQSKGGKLLKEINRRKKDSKHGYNIVANGEEAGEEISGNTLFRTGGWTDGRSLW